MIRKGNIYAGRNKTYASWQEFPGGMADCLLFYRSRSDLSKFEKSINMWNFYQPAGWFIEKSDGIFCHPCSCGTAVE